MMSEERRKQTLWSELASWVAGLAAAITMAAAIASFLYFKTDKAPGIEIQFLRDIDGLKKQIGHQEATLNQLSSQVKTITSANGQTPLEVQIAGLRGEVANVAKRVDGLD